MEFSVANPTAEAEEKELDDFSFLAAGPEALLLGVAENISISVLWRFTPPAAFGAFVVFATETRSCAVSAAT